jgi:L-fucose isomerase-like protein
MSSGRIAVNNPRAAFVGFGEVNTPRAIIERLCSEARRRIEGRGVDLVWTEPVSDDPDGKDVARAVSDLARADFDLLILCIAGWIPSHAVIAVADRFRHKPMVLLGLRGWNEGGRLVTTACQAGTTALRKPMSDMGYCFKYVVSGLDAPEPFAEVVTFAKAARAAALLRGARIGQAGYRDMNLYGTLHEGVSLRARIGPEVECFDLLELVQIMDALDSKAVAAAIDLMRQRWTFVSPAQEATLRNTAKLFLAFKRKIEARRYQAVSYMDVDGVKRLLKFAPAASLMLLHEETDVCSIPENDTPGAVTQLIVRYLTDQVAAYMEFYDFTSDGVLMGVPDYVPSQIVDGPVAVMPTAFGGFGEGLLNVSQIKTGPVTLARLGYSGDRYALHVVGGMAQRPRAWEEAGWKPPAPQPSSLEIRLDVPMADFMGKVLGQHYILSYGDNTALLSDLSRILGVERL